MDIVTQRGAVAVSRCFVLCCASDVILSRRCRFHHTVVAFALPAADPYRAVLGGKLGDRAGAGRGRAARDARFLAMVHLPRYSAALGRPLPRGSLARGAESLEGD